MAMLPKMMLGFVVRRCTVEVGHAPTPEEFAAWANDRRNGERTFCLFGRAITIEEARLILRHPAREVSARDVPQRDCSPADGAGRGDNTISFAAAAARLKRRVGARRK